MFEEKIMMKGEIEYVIKVKFKVYPLGGISDKKIFARMIKQIEKDLPHGVIEMRSGDGYWWKAGKMKKVKPKK